MSVSWLCGAWMWWVYVVNIGELWIWMLFIESEQVHFSSLFCSLQFQFWMFGYQTGEVGGALTPDSSRLRFRGALTPSSKCTCNQCPITSWKTLVIFKCHVSGIHYFRCTLQYIFPLFPLLFSQATLQMDTFERYFEGGRERGAWVDGNTDFRWFP